MVHDGLISIHFSIVVGDIRQAVEADVPWPLWLDMCNCLGVDGARQIAMRRAATRVRGLMLDEKFLHIPTTHR